MWKNSQILRRCCDFVWLEKRRWIDWGHPAWFLDWMNRMNQWRIKVGYPIHTIHKTDQRDEIEKTPVWSKCVGVMAMALGRTVSQQLCNKKATIPEHSIYLTGSFILRVCMTACSRNSSSDRNVRPSGHHSKLILLWTCTWHMLLH